MYYHNEGRELTREKIRIRDNHTCQICGFKWEIGQRRLDVHHKDFDKEKTRQYDHYEIEKDNLITLCHKCHLNLPEHRNKMSEQSQKYWATHQRTCNKKIETKTTKQIKITKELKKQIKIKKQEEVLRRKEDRIKFQLLRIKTYKKMLNEGYKQKFILKELHISRQRLHQIMKKFYPQSTSLTPKR